MDSSMHTRLLLVLAVSMLSACGSHTADETAAQSAASGSSDGTASPVVATDASLRLAHIQSCNDPRLATLAAAFPELTFDPDASTTGAQGFDCRWSSDPSGSPAAAGSLDIRGNYNDSVTTLDDIRMAQKVLQSVAPHVIDDPRFAQHGVMLMRQSVGDGKTQVGGTQVTMNIPTGNGRAQSVSLLTSGTALQLGLDDRASADMLLHLTDTSTR